VTLAQADIPFVLAPPPTAGAPRAGLCWGLTPLQLHDLFWAARGVQVVRPGQPPDARGPGVFLLLPANRAVLASAAPLLERLTWSGSRWLRVRLVDRSEAGYHERVVSAPDGSFVRVHRYYPRRARTAARAVITADARVARAWAALTPGSERWRDIPRATDRSQRGAAVCDARLFDLTGARAREELLRTLVREWREPGRVIPGVYQLKPGVWTHELSGPPPDTRLVGPLWLGAGIAPGGPGPVIGPAVIADEVECPAPGPVDWEALRLPAFPLTPRVRAPLSRRLSKRAFDVVFALGAMLATLPIYPLVMLAIYLEDGRPFFFAHKRQTLGGRDFPCWKFRTMVKNAEQLKAQLVAQNACDGPQFFIARDPRLLRCGRLLRRLQIDELPQFWNVLLGHMSVVGPRPSPDRENQFCPAWREARLSVRPGITGLWQVRRTRLPETDFQEWIRYDLEYVQHQSWRMDLWIIFETVRRIVGG
jgi:lipopolysaccharide/colanic/teichoic acid biosynthesis glycosyltransferase